MPKRRKRVGRRVTFERGRIHRAQRDVLARRLARYRGVRTPYALATHQIKRGVMVRDHAVAREFAEQKRMGRR